ncbi:hypothetical protein [Paenibacillus spongiae]|uniref:Uncharacterized protein n=1 Tax=Paenibacillus spongiae TaxID=2909671 RepID=A0ABY5SG21_9BACL|nr:hypothetical protein [Paenibacillus spongiae]UVI31213.1 hypothetical protein L1F29_05045 [Paenibacillus spongiae]
MAEKKAAITESEMDQITKTTADLLREQPKVKIKIYLAPDERKRLESAKEAGKKVEWPSEFVSINGHNFQIQKGVEVEVPETVKEILEQAGLI